MNRKQFADQYVLIHSNKFQSSKLQSIRAKLAKVPEKNQIMVQSIPLKNPIITLILSLFLGSLALDRFYIGDIKLALLKIITIIFLIGCIWIVIDWFLTYNKTKKINYKIIMALP